MSNGIGINIDAPPKKKHGQKITERAFRILVVIILILAVVLIHKTEENRELKQQVRDLTIMVTAERSDATEPARGGMNDGRD